jgi:hypothetical protein
VEIHVACGCVKYVKGGGREVDRALLLLHLRFITLRPATTMARETDTGLLTPAPTRVAAAHLQIIHLYAMSAIGSAWY